MQMLELIGPREPTALHSKVYGNHKQRLHPACLMKVCMLRVTPTQFSPKLLCTQVAACPVGQSYPYTSQPSSSSHGTSPSHDQLTSPLSLTLPHIDISMLLQSRCSQPKLPALTKPAPRCHQPRLRLALVQPLRKYHSPFFLRSRFCHNFPLPARRRRRWGIEGR